jgi:hypothetical protein
VDVTEGLDVKVLHNKVVFAPGVDCEEYVLWISFYGKEAYGGNNYESLNMDWWSTLCSYDI